MADWRPLEPWQPGEAIGHLLHDVNNLLLPLTLCVGLLDEGAAAQAAEEALAVVGARTRQLTWSIEPPAPATGTRCTELAELLAAATPASAVDACTGRVRVDPDVLQQACLPFGVPAVRSTAHLVTLEFPGQQAWLTAAQAPNPASPYAAPRVHLSLTVLTAVARAAGGTVDLDRECGGVRVTLPCLP